ncbi:RraA family protein [Mangrovicoccus ximenensis]|uniref:RraA family protein n=1 Tax=Mangrovicoccus ximenensis TaxID=1911570 RepID=UPI000D39C09D
MPTLASAGAILVLATGGFQGGAVMGGLLAEDLLGSAVAGVVTDGLVRDRRELADGPLPVHATGSISQNGARRMLIASWTQPVVMPGPESSSVVVRPGDILLGDEDGVVTIPAEMAGQILDMGEELARKEALLRSTQAAMSAAERAEARAARSSHIAWIRT